MIDGKQQLHRLETALRYGGVFVWETDVKAQTITVSAALMERLHYPVDRLTRDYSEWSKLFPENDWEIAMDEINDCIRHHTNEFITQHRMIGADGKTCWFQARGTPEFDDEGRVVRFIGASVDITKQKNSEQQLLRMFERVRRERDRATLFQEIACVGMIEVRLEDKVVMVDENYAVMIGFPRKPVTFTFNEWKKVVLEEDWIFSSEAVNNCLREKARHQEFKFRARHKDGSVRHIKCRMHIIKGQTGQVLGAIGATLDITDSETLVTNLEAEASFFKNVIEGLPIGAVLVKGETVYINNAIERLTGYKREELSTLDDWFRLLHPGKAFEMRRFYKLMRHAHPSRRGDIKIITRAGDALMLQIAAHCENDLDVWVLSDISQGVRLERIMRQSEIISASGSWELDCTTNRLYWSEGMYRLHEITPGEVTLTKERAIGFFTKEYQSLICECLDRAVSQGEGWDFEAEKITAHGNRFWVRSIGVPEMEDGHVIRIFGAVIDITSQKIATLETHTNHSKKAVVLDMISARVK